MHPEQYYLSANVEFLDGAWYTIERLSQHLLNHNIPLSGCVWEGHAPRENSIGHVHDRNGKVLPSYTITVQYEINWSE